MDRSSTQSEHRDYRPSDRILMALDAALRGVSPRSSPSPASPAASIAEGVLTGGDKARSAELMRVNHTGELCAQALYAAQGVWSRDTAVRTLLEQASAEELAHLAWCEERLVQLDANASRLNPFWFTGAYLMGSMFALFGDRWSLGFLEETERQVVAHLADHLSRLPPADRKSRAILSRMQRDEARHSANATRQGARTLPALARMAMKVQAAIMKSVAARI